MNKRISNLEQVMYARSIVLNEGEAKGKNLIDVYNGVLECLISVDNGLDITSLKYRGVNISYLSKMGINSKLDDFPYRFEGGLLYTCGLDNIGTMNGKFKHGMYHLKKAILTKKIVNENEIIIEGEVFDNKFFEQNLKLKRTIKFNYLFSKFYIEDEVLNIGYEEAKYCLLYHFNLGYPFLDENCEIKFGNENIVAKTEIANKNISRQKMFETPCDNSIEEVFYCLNNNGLVEVFNKKSKLKFKLKYDSSLLPIIAQWKSYKSGDYALGLEPSTSKMDNEIVYKTLKPSEKIVYKFEIEITE